ncbi:MAG: hypothetical protein PHD73_04220 [Sediminibacterium sp.]|nr:hypothetical protein [Sediminibacterium sp.]
MRHFLLLTLVLSSIGVFAQKDSSKITIPEGTEVKLKTIVELKGNELKVGDKINLELAEPIIIDDNIVVRPGAKASATVSMASRSKAFGKKGKLEFSIDYLYLTGGKVIKLKSTVASNAKGRGVTTAAVSVLVTPLGLLWHGQQAKFPPGTVFAAYVDHDTVIN